VIAFGEGDIPTARKSFEASSPATGNGGGHGPTLNNLAVVLMRQNQAPAALNAYVRAMQASPGDRRILDNVAEALNGASQEPKLNGAVKKTAAVFSPQDVALAGQLASQGFYRWGATWVSQAELDKLQAIEKEVKQQQADLDRQFRAAQENVKSIENEIAANERSLNRIEANSTIRDVNGNLVRLEYPPAYNRLQQDNADLKLRRERELAKIDDIRADARKLQGKVPTPRYTGVQRLIGPEGAPNLPPVQSPAPTPAAGNLPPTPGKAPVATTSTSVPVAPNPGPPPRAQTP
jgi:hypothetical protein